MFSKQMLAVVVLVVVVFSGAIFAEEEADGLTLKVMTYNIQIGATTNNPGWVVANFDLDKVAAVISEQDPDIIALQEVDRLRSRSGYADQVGELAEKLGMYWAYSPSYFDVETTHGRGMYGNAILSKYPIVSQYPHTLYRRGKLEPGEANWVIEKRSILETKIDVNGTTVHVYSTHLSTTQDQREHQTAEITTLLSQTRGPKILMGDFNAEPDDPEMKNILRRYRDVLDAKETPSHLRATYPNGSKSTIAIDYILLSREWEIKDASVIVEESGASDHNPIVATITLAK
ncbi:MAG: endonuclease/exonuclease/phosphatase family protein [Firmicutes bacterium]|nr:endonuclease/exonuclease/phosphatase family protein [Bacillota bacterium]MDD4263764.1 endonuclease/exonuclease/phosphatase family protein [Bacillota bacterium]MDD4693096.1 endonuclease/exonuclease/phosphatase family protein [Bacillota bacterium]